MLELAVKSDLGRVRETNEDSCYASLGQLSGEQYALLAVADGMGGHRAGDVASQKAVDWFVQAATTALLQQTEPLEALQQAVAHANSQLYAHSSSSPHLAGMGTTFTAALIYQGQLSVAHVGDSRLYVCRAGVCRQLTSDHSLVGDLIKNGKLSEEEAQHHPQRHLLHRALGTHATVEIEILEQSLQPGDLVLICSDGLSTLLNRAELAEILGQHSSLRDSADSLVAEANRRGGHDNITVVMARWGWGEQ